MTAPPSAPSSPNPPPPATPSEASPAEIVAPLAEVTVREREVVVTLPFPELASEDLAWYVGSNLVLVWSKRAPDTMRTLVHLPVDVDTERTLVRFTNGVVDFTLIPRSDSTPPR